MVKGGGEEKRRKNKIDGVDGAGEVWVDAKIVNGG